MFNISNIINSHFISASGDEFEKLRESERKRPAMYFGSNSLRGLHIAISTFIIDFIMKDSKHISLTLNNADIIISHEGELLKPSYDSDFIVAACETFIYKDNRFNLRFDKAVFKTTVPNEDALFDMLRELAFLNKDLHITFNAHEFHYEKGLFDFYEYLQLTAGHYWSSKNIPGGFHAEKDGMALDAVFDSASLHFDTCVYSYANNMRTQENGVHADAFMCGLRTVLSGYRHLFCEDIKSVKDIEASLIIHVRVEKPMYEGATKRKLGGSELYQFVLDATIENLSRIFEENPLMLSAFVKCWRCGNR